MIGMTMLVTIFSSIVQRLGKFIQGLKASVIERQGRQLVPPGFDQVQPVSVLGNELQLHMAGTISCRNHQNDGLSRRWFKAAVHPQIAVLQLFASLSHVCGRRIIT